MSKVKTNQSEPIEGIGRVSPGKKVSVPLDTIIANVNLPSELEKVLVSDCCSARIYGDNPMDGICADCGEHCGGVELE